MTSSERFKRNHGLIGQATQTALGTADIAIAGVGGVGGKVAVDLVRLGVTKLRLADPDTFSETNLNRQEGSTTATLGRKKVEVIAALCRDINPQVKIAIFDQGVNAANLENFLTGATQLIEATDFMLPHLGVMLARAARAHAIPLLMGVEIGFGATLTWFKPTGYTYEQYFGLPINVSLEALASGAVTVVFTRWLPHVPRYASLASLQRVIDGKTDVPAIAPAVAVCSSIITTQVVALAEAGRATPAAPAVFHVDVREHRSRLIRWPRWHHYCSLGIMIITNYFGRADQQ